MWPRELFSIEVYWEWWKVFSAVEFSSIDFLVSMILLDVTLGESQFLFESIKIGCSFFPITDLYPVFTREGKL